MSDRTRSVARASVALAVLITIGLAVLQVTYYRHAGALWRDEVNSVNVATAPTFVDVWARSPLDSFPVAWVTVLHGWMAVSGSTADGPVRQLGLLIGLALVGVLWWSARRLGLAAPLIALLLFCLSPTAIIYGDEVRGYGLAALAIAWCMGALWSFLERRTVAAFVVAQLAALTAVQAYYANCFLLLALGGGAVSVAALRREPRTVLATLALGAVAAASLLIDFAGLAYAARVAPIEQGDWSFAWLLGVFRQALAPEVPLLQGVWLAALVLAAGGVGLTWRSPLGPSDRARALYVAVTAAAAVVAYFFCLRFIARLPTQYWYYLSLMALLALCCDVGIDLLVCRYANGAALRVGAVALAALAAAPSVARVVPMRMTNLDQIAAALQDSAQPQDLIVVVPWYNGISFARYYRGAAPWITVPDLEEHEYHGHLEVAERMQQGASGVEPELQHVARTLREGGKVWVVGAPPALPPGETLPDLPPAPSGPQRWRAAPYLDWWELELGTFLQTHGRDTWQVPLPDAGPVNTWERSPLLVVEGWH